VPAPASPREKSIPDRRSGHPVDTLHAVETVPVMPPDRREKSISFARASSLARIIKVISSSRLSRCNCLMQRNATELLEMHVYPFQFRHSDDG